MKKTITINLAGIVFHIEEDAYEALQKYLQSVKQYFLTVEGGADILGDIETRIAEIFSGIITGGKQAISIEDVELVVRQMGTVEDMVGEEEAGQSQAHSGNGSSNAGDDTFSGTRRLYRDTSNALVGGVCSGIAAYFEINPLWVRLATLAGFFGLFILPPISGFVFLSYIILWIAMPGQSNLDNKGKFRKFFRNRKDKVLGGVAGGIASFFGIDPVVVRVIFVLFIAAGGSGVLFYIILWALTPEAKTVTDEMQMEGEPVTLSNIEDRIKRNVKLEDKNTESLLVRILVFPFKIISMVIAALAPMMRFLFEAFRLFVGFVLFLIGGVLLFGCILFVMASLGLLPGWEDHIQLGDIPVPRIAGEISPWIIGFGSVAIFIPVVLILMVSLSLFLRKTLVRPLVLTVLVTLFLIGAIGFGFAVLPLARNFTSDGAYTTKKMFVGGYKSMHIRMNNPEEKHLELYPVSLTIRSWSETYPMLSQRFKAQGRSWKDANQNAMEVEYDAHQEDSTLIFDANLRIDNNKPFRFPRLKMILHMPLNQVFTMDPKLEEILLNTLHPYGYAPNHLEGNQWIYTEAGLKCLTCPEKPSRSEGTQEDPDSPEPPNHEDDEWD
jgi:phage shock protein PspC (stress-responsive transcriptional regulator)